MMPAGRDSPRRGVLLLNFGGPRDLSEVATFIYEILRDPNTIQLGAPQWVQNRLARFIAGRRAGEVARQYGEIGGRSPIVPATDALVAALAARLAADGTPLPVWAVHRYLPGQIDPVLDALLEAEVDELLALPLYPHFSFATSGSSFQQLQQGLDGRGFRGRAWGIRSYPDAPGYLDAVAARLEATLSDAGADPAETVILCSAHGLPAAYVERGDPYRFELYRTLDALRVRFPRWRFALSFQSRVGPATWLQPYTDEILPELGAQGVKCVVFLPLAFVNDHIETLYEIAVTYFALARQAGMTPHLVPAIETHEAYVAELAGLVQRWRQGQTGIPLAELQPPPQAARRHDRWALLLWLAALFAALGFAIE